MNHSLWKDRWECIKIFCKGFVGERLFYPIAREGSADSVEEPEMEAFITLATNDAYATGACVLAHSLRRSNTTKQIAVMITPEVSEDMRTVLNQLFDHVEVVDLLNSGDESNLALLSRKDLGLTFTKLHCWRMTQYTKAAFMDADTLVIRNVDDMFERDEFSAAPDPGWPDCFNSGVFVFRPSLETYRDLVNFAAEHGSFDGADQGLLNRYFHDWATKDISRHLPFTYNCVSHVFYSYLPALKEFRSKVRVIHFIGAEKPWHYLDAAAGSVRAVEGSGLNSDLLRQWLAAFQAGVRPLMSAELTQALSELSLAHQSSADVASAAESPLTDEERRENWDRGEIDFTGADKFENIQAKLNESIRQ